MRRASEADAAMRRKVREQLQIPPKAFVIGMLAPFQPEYDHATLLKAAGDLIKTNPDLTILLAGHGVQKGNAPLMALVGGGALGARTHLLGEWSDVDVALQCVRRRVLERADRQCAHDARDGDAVRRAVRRDGHGRAGRSHRSFRGRRSNRAARRRS